ncbi:helix-turn-helix domain-containing protein [Streptomyces mirabilis]|uniref:helix-turn-helix domain-containing protein n=1 Tax=Streptomyces mirabilis TaxID=68239 RepID=UPI00369929D4
MSDDEEVQRVFDAIEDVEQIADPEARSRARAKITAKTRQLSARWNAERAELAVQMQGEGETVRGIADRLGIKAGTVQDLLRGYKGSGLNRPLVAEKDDADGPSEK